MRKYYHWPGIDVIHEDFVTYDDLCQHGNKYGTIFALSDEDAACMAMHKDSARAIMDEISVLKSIIVEKEQRLDRIFDELLLLRNKTE